MKYYLLVLIWAAVQCSVLVYTALYPPRSGTCLHQKPHSRGLQLFTSRQTLPGKAVLGATDIVHSTVGAIAVPESTATDYCAVSWRPRVVVAVICGEHSTVAVAECIKTAGATREPGHLQLVVGRLGQYSERAVLGVVPVAVAKRLQVELQLVVAALRQLTEFVVAEPVVSAWVTKSHFVLCPRTIEEVRPVQFLLDQYPVFTYRTVCTRQLLFCRNDVSAGLPCRQIVFCRLDYCNSLLAGVADVRLRRLQSVQNAAASLVSGARRHDHITLILTTLHRLPVRQRVIFKTAVLVWKCLHDAAPRSSVCRRRLRTVVASLALRSPGLSWCPGLGRLLATAALLRMAPGPGTDYPRLSDHQNWLAAWRSG